MWCTLPDPCHMGSCTTPHLLPKHAQLHTIILHSPCTRLHAARPYEVVVQAKADEAVVLAQGPREVFYPVAVDEVVGQLEVQERPVPLQS